MATAWAAMMAGYNVHFYADTDVKSTLYGCQYLHAPIPVPKRFKVQETHVEYKLNGTADEYRVKVYGSAWAGTVSPEDLAGEHDAWDIRATYDALWELITRDPHVVFSNAKISDAWINAHSRELSRYAHVISTVPAMSLCESPAYTPSMSGHMFYSHTIKAVGSTIPFAAQDQVPDHVLCDGTDEVPWYRSALVFGYRTIEWPRKWSEPNAVVVRKPLHTECTCHPEIVRLGRYGAWRKGILVHNVYEDATTLMENGWVNE